MRTSRGTGWDLRRRSPCRLDEAREAIEPVRAMMPGYTPSRFHWGARYVYGSRFRGDLERDYRVLRDALNACLARPTAPPAG